MKEAPQQLAVIYRRSRNLGIQKRLITEFYPTRMIPLCCPIRQVNGHFFAISPLCVFQPDVETAGSRLHLFIPTTMRSAGAAKRATQRPKTPVFYEASGRSPTSLVRTRNFSGFFREFA